MQAVTGDIHDRGHLCKAQLSPSVLPATVAGARAVGDAEAVAFAAAAAAAAASEIGVPRLKLALVLLKIPQSQLYRYLISVHLLACFCEFLPATLVENSTKSAL